MTIGEKIKKVRSLRGLTQKELGLLIGLSNVRVQQYESGYRIPQGKIMKDICDALEVSEHFFVSHHMETEEDIIQLLFDLGRSCSMEVIQIDRKNAIYGISFKDDIINEALKEWYKKQELMKSGELSELDFEWWQLTYPSESN